MFSPVMTDLRRSLAESIFPVSSCSGEIQDLISEQEDAMNAENRGGKVPPITSGNIKKICKKYGFTYAPETQESDNGGEKREVPVVKLGEEAVPVSFDDDGNLPKKRRHKFLEVARRMSEEFRSDYPPAFPFSRTLKPSPVTGSHIRYCPILEAELFKRYSLDDLAKAKSALDAAMEEKQREERDRLAAERTQEMVVKLRTIDDLSKQCGIEPPLGLKVAMEEAQSKLAELAGTRKAK
jgi:hypothetical protein